MNCPTCHGAIANELWISEPPIPPVIVPSTAAEPVTSHTVTCYCDFCDAVYETTIRVDRSTGSMSMATVQMFRGAAMRPLLARLPAKGAGQIFKKKIGRRRSNAAAAR